MKSIQLAGYIVLMLYKKGLVSAQNRFAGVASMSNKIRGLDYNTTSRVPRRRAAVVPDRAVEVATHSPRCFMT
jgi:hypothetical protein